ncbi:MAG TPA: cytochrome c oxidase subunit II [Terriglobales bacterium]|nr:cytochrome c oxidase subunit II [Terriglobales bacterium]
MNFSFFPARASTLASEVDALYLFLIAVSTFFGLLIASLIVYLSLRFRRRHPDQVGEPIRGSVALELVWTVTPFVIAMTMFLWGAKVYLAMHRPPDNAIQVFAVGRQWMWKIQHMEGRREINELHVPIGQPVRVTLTSEDVIHSFFVPAFRMKMDAVPGRYTTTWFEPTMVGEYHLFCAEYCGTAHSRMIGKVVVMEQDDYQAWLSGEGPDQASAAQGSMASTGASLFEQKGCVTCHQSQPGALGPVLAGIAGKARPLQDGTEVVADDAYLRESILNPQAKMVSGYQPVMPTFKGQLTEEQVLQLIQYIKGLS